MRYPARMVLSSLAFILVGSAANAQTTPTPLQKLDSEISILNADLCNPATSQDKRDVYSDWLVRRREEKRLLLDQKIAELNAAATESGMQLTADDQRDLDSRLKPLRAELASLPSGGEAVCPTATELHSSVARPPSEKPALRTISGRLPSAVTPTASPETSPESSSIPVTADLNIMTHNADIPPASGARNSSGDPQTPAAITVTISGAPSTLAPGSTSQFSATVKDAAGVNWTVACSQADCGKFSPATTLTGVKTTYTAPAAAPASGGVTVTATSVTNAGASQEAVINISSQSNCTLNAMACSLGFGVALGFEHNVYGAPIVTNASIDANGIVRVNTRANTTVGFMLEMHDYWGHWGKPTNPHGEWGLGPFISIRPGTDQVISAVGAGIMLGHTVDSTGKKGLGLGFGYEAIPSAQTLGAGFVGNQKAPVGPNGMPLPLQYETQDKGSIVAIASFTFNLFQ